MSEEGARKIQHVVPLLALTRLGTEVSSTSSRRLRNLEVSESWRELASMARAEIVGEPSIVTTVRDLNVMILETEILAFNFTVVTYFLGRKRGEMSFEEEAALIESPAFSLEEHIIDDDIDTHCLVASSDDRVFVAFRGTASEANARTDLAMQLVPWDLANDVELVNDLQNAQETRDALRL
ncbi:Hypothetical Protein FCC1311_007801 [Hondaea fermentalgiana]|uniref:Uncharacterized protein n=1 Tax=Hondaea fermentalgiana TaxID=2315210 RepID=A0A2R5GTB1_9STRA|nr:Hypothetical Protein FCC1311_007801 [Hondaea fermentalgiana]|eukprot:GBG31124.1 Hypothetical Protein FCC1311_007801 [Hondaea fermentalgiana]